jgi:hypothetical protein
VALQGSEVDIQEAACVPGVVPADHHLGRCSRPVYISPSDLRAAAEHHVTNYLFLEDHMDRGSYSLNMIALFFAYEIKDPTNFFLFRGNHECHETDREYGFWQECQQAFSQSLV